jgi:hypothetical protein
MFDALLGRPGSSGFLGNAAEAIKPRLETLEDRSVPALIGGIVYNDLNHNGLFDANEQGIANSTLQLYDGAGRFIATTVSNAQGRYQFTQRMFGTNQPGQQMHEVNFDQTRTNTTRTGSLPLFDATLGRLTSVEIIAEGNLTSAVQLENLESTATEMKAELKGSIRYQVGGLVLQAAPERILTGTLQAFDGQADLQGASARDFGPTRMDGTFNRLTITNPAELASFTGQGALNVAQNASITGCACGTGNLLAMIRSTSAGKVKIVYHYQPSNELGPGNYTIVQTPQPSGFIDGLETKDNITSIVGSSRTDHIRVGVVNRNDQLITNHFGELRAGALSGWVYHDVDRSGTFAGTDAALANVTILLQGTDVFGNVVSRSTTTNVAGAYVFGGLAPGSYTVREVQPSGYLQGVNTPGTTGGQVSGDAITLTLPQGASSRNNNFGEWLAPNTPPPNPIVTPVPRPSKFFLFSGYDGAFGW